MAKTRLANEHNKILRELMDTQTYIYIPVSMQSARWR